MMSGPGKAFLAAACVVVVASAAYTATAAETVKVLVLRENGVGGSAQAQPYLDSLLAAAARANGWPAAEGKYLTRRQIAEAYIGEQRPHFAILSLGAFLAMKKDHRLTVIGQVSVVAGGGRQYFMVSKKADSLKQCLGQKLVSDHLQDTRFVERVVAAGAFRLADFEPVVTRRPVQTLKAVIRDQALCALIDDAQKSAAGKVEHGDLLKVVWTSRELPGMPVVAFPAAGAQRTAAFKKSLSTLCQAEASEACKKVGITALSAASGSLYGPLQAAYDR